MDLIICRCEGVTEDEVTRAVHEWGAASPNEVKLITRAGKGTCAGRCCNDLVARVVADETGKRSGALLPPSIRPPVRPVAFATAARSTEPIDRLAGNVLTVQTAAKEEISY